MFLAILVGLIVLGVVAYSAYEVGYWQGSNDKAQQMRSMFKVVNGKDAEDNAA